MPLDEIPVPVLDAHQRGGVGQLGITRVPVFQLLTDFVDGGLLEFPLILVQVVQFVGKRLKLELVAVLVHDGVLEGGKDGQGGLAVGADYGGVSLLSGHAI